MPESTVSSPSLPAVLKQNLSATEQAVLTFAANGGGPRQVYLHVDSCRSEAVAEEMIVRVREKAARLLAAQRTKNGSGEASCARHGAYTDRGRGCPVCNVGEGGGARPKPAAKAKVNGVEAPPLPPTSARRPKRKAREEQRERSEEAARRAELRRKALEVAGEDEDSPVLSEQDGTLPQDVGRGGAVPPVAPPAADSDGFEAPAGDPASATDGAPLVVREPSPEERAAREAQIGPIIERGQRQAIANEEGPWPREDHRHAARGASVEEQLADRLPAKRQRSKADIVRGRARLLALLREGPKSQQALALELSVTTSQVQNDLRRMAADGDVERTERFVFDWPVPEGGHRGRASTQWRITADGQADFERALLAGDETTGGDEDAGTVGMAEGPAVEAGSAAEREPAEQVAGGGDGGRDSGGAAAERDEEPEEREEAEAPAAVRGPAPKWTREGIIEVAREVMLELGRELTWNDIETGPGRDGRLPSGFTMRRHFDGVPALMEACREGWAEGERVPAREEMADCEACGRRFRKGADNAVFCRRDECQRERRRRKAQRRHEAEREALDRVREEPQARPPVGLAPGASEALIEAERWAQLADGALPDTLLKGRYLAALLKRIEAGDTDPGLLDRFERLAGME